MIIDQLKEYCGCIDDVTEQDVNELINLISMMTGWATNPCDTFLTGERREIIDLPSCADCPIEFEPYYHPFVEDSFKFYLVKQKGLEETITEINDFAYHSDGKFYVDMGQTCQCKKCECGCPSKYKLIAEYTAGYEDIPECLLPVFCNVLEVIHAKNTCDCNDCGCDNEEQVKYASGDVVSVQLETDIGKMLVENYKNQIGFLSLVKHKTFWGMVV